MGGYGQFCDRGAEGEIQASTVCSGPVAGIVETPVADEKEKSPPTGGCRSTGFDAFWPALEHGLMGRSAPGAALLFFLDLGNNRVGRQQQRRDCFR